MFLPTYKNILFALLAGILMAIPFLIPVLFVSSIIGLLFIIHISETHILCNKKFSEAMPLIFLTFLLFNGIATYWISEATISGYITLALINASIMLLFFRISYFIRTKLSNKFLFIAYAAPWLTMEYLNHSTLLYWPWLSFGNCFAAYPNIVQWYEYTGVLGGSAWIWCIAIVIYGFKNKLNSRKQVLIRLSALVLIIAFPYLFPNHIPTKYNKSINACILQPNVNPYTQKFEDKYLLKNEQLLNHQIDSAISLKPNIIVAPETAIIEKIWLTNPYINSIVATLQKKVDSTHCSLVIGCYSYSGTTSKFNKNTDSLHNSIAILSPHSPIQFYHKNILVYGFEKIPIPALARLIQSPSANDTLINLYSKPSNNVFSTANILFGPILCYESAFGTYVSERAINANVLTIATNDGWWSNAAGYEQHFNLSKLRAIETRCTVIRSGNTGISATILPSGECLQKTTFNQQTILLTQVPIYNYTTVYEQYGDIIGITALFSTIMLLLISTIKKRFKKS